MTEWAVPAPDGVRIVGTWKRAFHAALPARTRRAILPRIFDPK